MLAMATRLPASDVPVRAAVLHEGHERTDVALMTFGLP
jgi:hypothetical protein